MGCLGRKYPHLCRKCEIGWFRWKTSHLRRKIRNWVFRSKKSKMGCIGRKYPIQVEKFENGAFRSKIFHFGQKIRKWIVLVENILFIFTKAYSTFEMYWKYSFFILKRTHLLLLLHTNFMSLVLD